MPGLTVSAMSDARDAEDRRLLEAGEHQRLVDGYTRVIIERCTVKTRSRAAGVDVAAEVVLRLLSELKRGKTYAVPFRVVVHNVIGWKVKEHFARRDGQEVELVDDPVDVEDVNPEGLERESFEALLEGLTELEWQVVTLRWWHGLEPEEIAAKLGRTRNAIDQRLHHAHRKIRERLEGT